MTDDERRVIKAALFAVFMHKADAFLIEGDIIKKDDVVEGLFDILDNKKKEKVVKK